MKKTVVLLVVLSFMTFNSGFSSPAFSEDKQMQTGEVVEKIEAEEVAKELAAMAEGEYVKGEAVPELEGGQVSLPIIDEESGKILGHVIADKAKLVAVLNEAGLTEVAGALAAMEAGAAAGGAVAAGISMGTMTWVAIGVAAVAGVAALAGGGGGGGGSTTEHR